MGTLTANVPRLAEHCPHKLATSCRLTATPRCCACADRRAHTSTYSIYIDGIGFVRRGTRWQSYCWFCREFWNNRVRACGLEAGQTRIPDEPDQSAFLERWFEFHQGFRVVAGEGRKQEKVAVLGEPLRDVAPGELPKTLEELRQGRRRSETEASREVSRRNPASASVEASRSQANVSVEEFLDDLLNELSDDDDTAVRLAFCAIEKKWLTLLACSILVVTDGEGRRQITETAFGQLCRFCRPLRMVEA